ncbi:hypothetical protein J6590_082366 [Homalodisca vitripennis]|nr:hypothetical protein J6590_082366 [Homalodisca vitripennis]
MILLSDSEYVIFSITVFLGNFMLINADLSRVRLWADDHGLQLNPRNCSLVNFYPSSNAVFLGNGPLGVSLNSAVRFVYGLIKFDHVSQYRRTARILPIKCIFKLQVACLVHKVLRTGKLSYLRGMLQTRAEIRDCHTRQDAKLEVPMVRLEMRRKGFRYFGPQIYNSVPHSLKAYGYSSFKNNLRLALEEECFTPK